MNDWENLDIADREKVLEFFAENIEDTWDKHAEDILVDDYGCHDESIEKSRDDVFEISVDLYFGTIPGGGEELELYWLWEKEDPAFAEDLKMKAFPHSVYGW